MRKMVAVAGVACVVAALLYFAPRAFSDKEDAEAEAKTKKAAESVNAFGLDLYGKLKEKDGNLFMSPSSVSTALGMAYAGARGRTAEEMKKVLHFTLADKELHPAMGNLAKLLVRKEKGCKVSIANALWGQQGEKWLDSFLNLQKKSYGAGLNEVDFKEATEQARKMINTWVEDKTNKKIKDLLKPGVLKPLTKLVLTNAIHFKGTWKKQFKKTDTRKAKFRLDAKKDVQVDMMHMRNEKFKYMQDADFQAVELPYTGEKLSMVVILPDKVDGLAEIEKKLSGEKLNEWLGKLHTTKVHSLSIPKFKMTCEFSLGETLKEMGMPMAFGMQADFSGMNGKKDLFISAVIHKAFVDVNEEGTEAAAATAVVMEGKSAAPRRTIFYADHPFLFLIRDCGTGSILFMGRLANPGS